MQIGRERKLAAGQCPMRNGRPRSTVARFPLAPRGQLQLPRPGQPFDRDGGGGFAHVHTLDFDGFRPGFDDQFVALLKCLAVDDRKPSRGRAAQAPQFDRIRLTGHMAA